MSKDKHLFSTDQVPTMESLDLGKSCGCPKSTSCRCSSFSSSKRKTTAPTSTHYFWKRTLKNPIQKKVVRSPGSVLTPSKLKFILPSSSATTMVINSNNNGQQQQQCGCANLFQISSCPLHPPTMEKLEPDVFIPALSNLSLGGNSSSLNQRLQKALNSAALAIPIPIQSPRILRRMRSLSWKRRIKCSLKDQVPCPSPPLPTISEEEEDEALNGGKMQPSCGQQSAAQPWVGVDDVTIDELASYLENGVFIPRKMSPMAEQMYT